jgi:DNA-binding MarR family transcriptional regulator
MDLLLPQGFRPPVSRVGRSRSIFGCPSWRTSCERISYHRGGIELIADRWPVQWLCLEVLKKGVKSSGLNHASLGISMHDNVLLNLLKCVYWFDDALQDNLSAQGFPRASRAISFILLNVAHGEYRATKIAKNLGISRQAVSQMLNELRDRGMLRMRVDPSDKRGQIVEFSPRFTKMGSACAEVLAQLEGELARRIGVRSFEAMRRGLFADWGSPPMIGELTREEIAHGEMLWKTESINKTPTRQTRGASTQRRSASPKSRPGRRVT